MSRPAPRCAPPHRLPLALVVLVALLLAPVPAPTASAAATGAPPTTAGMMSLSPNAAFTGGGAPLEVTSRSLHPGAKAVLVLSPVQGPEGEDLDIGATPLPGQYRAPVVAQGSGERWPALLDLRDPVSGTPAAPGLYDAGLVLDDAVVEQCTGCFTVLARTAPGLVPRTGLTPRRMQRGETLPVHLQGTSFADGTVVEVLLGGRTDRLVTVQGASVLPQGPDTDTLMTRDVVVDPTAALGHRDVRVTNTDGRSSVCAACLTITAPADKVEPTGITNDGPRLLRVSVPEVLPKTARLRLTWAGARAPAPALDLTASSSTVVPGPVSTIEGTVDFAGATPGLNAYHAGYVLPDGSVHDCEGLCRFTVRQATPPRITALKGLSGVKTAVRTLALTGTGFTRGTLVTSSDALVVVTSTRYGSPTGLTVVVQVDPDASGDPVEFTVTNPDDQSSTYDSDPLEPGPPDPPVPVEAAEEGDPDPSRAPEVPVLRASAASVPAQQGVRLSGRADAGTALDLFAVTRPSSTPVLLRTVTAVPDDGVFSFVVARSASTVFTVVSRNSHGRTASAPVGVQVRSSLLRFTPARVAPLRYQFSGSVEPRRKNQRVNVYDVRGPKPVLLGHGFTASDGTWRLTAPKRFLKPGRLRVQAVTATDAVNASGRSAVLTVDVC